jgi:serine protease
MTTLATRSASLLAITAASLALLVGSGGGGGGDAGPSPSPSPSPSPGPSYTLGGTLTVVENLAVDSDTNDPTQSPRVRNDALNTAQVVTASSQVLGSVNDPGAGPVGPNFVGGDPSDYFRVGVAAGQTVELDFSADPAINDIDLYVYDSAGVIVASSIGVGSAECVRISTAGEYRVEVYTFKGASLYNLRVTAPGASSSCANVTPAGGEATLTPGELIVGLRDGSARTAQAASAMSSGRLNVLRGRVAAGEQALVSLPSDATTRRRALSALAGGTATAADAAASGAAAQAYKDTVAYAKRLRAARSFDYVMFNRPVKTTALVGTFPPNDPRYSLQRWHYEQISLPTAMQLLTARSPQPTQRPIVAVVDTGIVADHPDLGPQLVTGYDFIASAASAGDNSGIDDNPDDLRSGETQPSFHGSHVAGTIAASTFDGQGAAGVAPMAQIMPLRALGKNGSGSFYDITQAIRYAARLANDSNTLPARRADVINLSLGAAGVACDADSATFFASVRAQGSIVVAATGNDANRPNSTAPVGYPANCASVIAVSATDPRRQTSYFSNTGSQVAIAAPGGDMRFSTTGTGIADGVYSTVATFDANGARVPTFAPLQGTSMATPHVAGVIALMRWIAPNITPAQVETLLAQGALTDEAGAVGRDTDFGWGIVNAAKAVRAAIEVQDGVPPAAQRGRGRGRAVGTGLRHRRHGARVHAARHRHHHRARHRGHEQQRRRRGERSIGRRHVQTRQLPRGGEPRGTAGRRVDGDDHRDDERAAHADRAGHGGEGGRHAGVGRCRGRCTCSSSTPPTNLPIRQADVQASGGRYVWSVTGVTVPKITIVAGTDYSEPLAEADRQQQRVDLELALVGAGQVDRGADLHLLGVDVEQPAAAQRDVGADLRCQAEAVVLQAHGAVEDVDRGDVGVVHAQADVGAEAHAGEVVLQRQRRRQVLEGADLVALHVDLLLLRIGQDQLGGQVRRQEVGDVDFRNGLVVHRQTQAGAVLVGRVQVHGTRPHDEAAGVLRKRGRHGGGQGRQQRRWGRSRSCSWGSSRFG